MAVLFYIFRGFAWMISRLPLPVIYVISDILRFFIQRVFRYRRKIIIQNLTSSFPDKSPQEIRKIMRRFYRNLADIALEVIKLQGISKKEMLKRFDFEGFEIMQNSFARGRSVIVAIGHCGNWEWMGTALGLKTPVKGYAIVKPLSSKHFHEYMMMLRHKLNADSTIPFRSTYRSMARHKKDFVSFNVIASDQTPLRSEINYWCDFLHHDTPFFMGIEKLAKSLDMDVVFIDNRRTSRGRYTGFISLITDEPKNTGELEITGKYIRMLENAIVTNPDNWLWSHKRWKHKRSADTPEVL
jgi:Kdo2-lipid IVA lauroyltransferase/acyltransferase